MLCSDVCGEEIKPLGHPRNLKPALSNLQEDIVWFQVSMDDSPGVAVKHRLGNGGYDLLHFVFVESSLLLELSAEVAPASKLHDEDMVLRLVVHIHDRQYIRMIQGRQNHNLGLGDAVSTYT